MKRAYVFFPLVLFLLLWEAMAHFSTRYAFLFSSPSRVMRKFIAKILSGELPMHFGVTALEAFSGLLLGMIVGSGIGFVFIYFPRLARYYKGYIIVLGSIPVFALAPMMIIWFGTGISMKVAMAFFSMAFVALYQAYQGGQKVGKRDHDFFTLNKATDWQRFRQLTFPASIDWLIQSLKLNAGSAILGAFIGEFIASDRGLGYAIGQFEKLNV